MGLENDNVAAGPIRESGHDWFCNFEECHVAAPSIISAARVHVEMNTVFWPSVASFDKRTRGGGGETYQTETRKTGCAHSNITDSFVKR